MDICGTICYTSVGRLKIVSTFVKGKIMSYYKFIDVVADLLNTVPRKETTVLKNFIKPKKITSKGIDLAIEKGMLTNWTEVGECIRFGIKQEKQSQCLIRTTG